MNVAVKTTISAATAVLAFLLGMPNASATTKLALDLDYATGIDEPGVDSGTGGALRLGQELDLVVVSLTPEIGGSYHVFAGEWDLKHYSGFVGGRLSFGKVLEPGVFAHVGIGHASAGDFVSETGPAFDFGLFLDLTVLPILDLGLHAAYDTLLLDSGENFDWIRVGAHASIGF